MENALKSTWQVLLCPPLATRSAHKIISDRGIQSIIPLVQITKRGKRTRSPKMHDELVMPGYVFIKSDAVFDDQLLFILFNGKGMRFMLNDNKRVEIDDDVMNRFIKRIGKIRFDPSRKKFFENGTKIRFSLGSFEGLVGIVRGYEGNYQKVEIGKGLIVKVLPFLLERIVV